LPTSVCPRQPEELLIMFHNKKIKTKINYNKDFKMLKKFSVMFKKCISAIVTLRISVMLSENEVLVSVQINAVQN
jgi:hypothetical protein